MFCKSPIQSKLFVYGCRKRLIQNVKLDLDGVEEEQSQQRKGIPDFASQTVIKFKCNVKQISCGYSHGLILAHEGLVFSLGSNQFGQRGVYVRGVEKQQPSAPTLIDSLARGKAVCVSAGLYHSFAVLEDGSVFSWGRGSEGQLGLGDQECREEPALVDLQGVNWVACGGSHTLFLTRNQTAFSCGDNYWGQLGVGNTTPSNSPKELRTQAKISQIAAGLEHSLLLSLQQEVLICGNNLFGQCGKEGVSYLNVPTALDFKQKRVTNIFASSGTFSAVKTSDNQVLIWGTASWGYCRKPTNVLDICSFKGRPQNQSTPILLKTCKVHFSSVILGDNYGILSDELDNFYLLGNPLFPESTPTSLSKLECLPLDIEKAPTLSAGKQFVISSKSFDPTPFHQQDVLSFELDQISSLQDTVKGSCTQCNMKDKYEQVETLLEKFKFQEIQLELARGEQQQTKQELAKYKLLCSEKDSKIQELKELIRHSTLNKSPSVSQFKESNESFLDNSMRKSTTSSQPLLLKQSIHVSEKKQNNHSSSIQTDNQDSRQMTVDYQIILIQDQSSDKSTILISDYLAENQKLDKSKIQANLNNSKNLIASIDTILVQFKTLNQEVPLPQASVEQSKQTSPTFSNPNHLIQQYFQRIENLQKNIDHSKKELRKSLESKRQFQSDEKNNSLNMSSSKMMKKNIENELSTKNAKGFEYSFVNNISESRQLFSEGKDRRNGSLLSMINNIEVRKNPRDARN